MVGLIHLWLGHCDRTVCIKLVFPINTLQIYLCGYKLILHVWSCGAYVWGCHDLVFGDTILILLGGKLRLLYTIRLFSEIDAIRLALNRHLRMLDILFCWLIVNGWFLGVLVNCAWILLKWVFINARKRWSDFWKRIFLSRSCSFWWHDWLLWRHSNIFGELARRIWLYISHPLFNFYESFNRANIFTENMILKVLRVVNSNFVSWLILAVFLLEGLVEIASSLVNLWRGWIALDLLSQIILLFCFCFERRRIITLFVQIIFDCLKFLFKLTYFCGLLIWSIIHRITSILIRILINIVINYFIIVSKFVSLLAANVIWVWHN